MPNFFNNRFIIDLDYLKCGYKMIFVIIRVGA
jgi:hypothetical protein